ncbi:MAG: hypothetical protein EOQ98_31405 [Mesorhizobium sp.]|uniref:hypothetical protein n=1 Tax=Mesorhizobium sp. TaxID=1871066 RepID=UPI000FE6B064|nr:hypothetical protein [Mesorhizobium sp.]RWO94295.1 MAG: hypothetical protein EOQ98_31405 [Mesorhizobium sp.]
MEMRSAQQGLVDIADESCTPALVVTIDAGPVPSGPADGLKRGGNPSNRKSQAEAKAGSSARRIRS